MIESIKIGAVKCEYLPRNEFIDWCKKSLLSDKLQHIVTLNPEMVVRAESDKAFQEAVLQADMRTPDGAGLIWARWFIRSNFWSLLPSLLAFPFVEVERITGVDAITDIAKLCEEENKKIYLMGGTTKQREGTEKYLANKLPALGIIKSPNTDDEEELLKDINVKKPDVLLVAYGAPKQTLWIAKNRARILSARIVMGVGGAFAILSEENSRAPAWLRRLNLEWVWRLILEPERLPRIWRATVKFPQIISVQKKKESKDTKI